MIRYSLDIFVKLGIVSIANIRGIDFHGKLLLTGKVNIDMDLVGYDWMSKIITFLK